MMKSLPAAARLNRSQTSSLYRSPSVRVFAAIALAVIAQLALGSSASAQGTMGVLPDPISSRELDDYAKRLGLSAQQRGALEAYHEVYKSQFAALREGDIEKYFSGNPSPNAGGNNNGGQRGGGRGGQGGGGMGGRGAGMGMLMGNTDRKAVEENLRDLKSINDKIKSLDNALFDQFQTLLTEDQSLALAGVRQARERERYSTGLGRMAMFTNPSTQVDLTALMTNITLSPDEKSLVSPLITTYESSLTSAVKKLHDDANDSTVNMMDKMEKLGFTAATMQATMQDGQRRGEMFEAFRTVWGEIMSDMNERAATIADLNRKTERSLNTSLSKENGRRLRDSFYRRAYPEIRGSSNTARAFETVMGFDDLTEEQKTAISGLHEQYLSQMDRLNEQMADAVDAQRKNRNPMDFGGGGDRGGRGRDGGAGGNPSDEEMNKLREQRQELTDNMRAQIDATIGPEMVEKLQQRVAEARDRGRGGEGRGEFTATFVTAVPLVVAGGAVDVAGAAVPLAGQTFTTVIAAEDLAGMNIELASRDPFVPVAISERDVQSYSDRLGLEEEARTILSGLHSEYTDRFKAIDDTEIQAVRDADENLWQRGENDRPTPPEPEAVDKVYSLRRAAIESIKALDAQFFNDVQVALLTDEQTPLLERVRNTRLRAIYNRGSGQTLNLGGRGGRDGGGGGGGGRAAQFVMGGFGVGGSSESGVDLSTVVEQSKIEPAVIKPLDPKLAEYESSATAAFQIMFENSMRVRQATDRMAGRFMRGDRGTGGGGGETVVTVNGDDIRKTMETEGRAAREAATTITTLNRETLDALLAALDGTNAATLKTAYNRKAFPDIYRDWRSAEPRLEAAMALPDLNDQQRDAVQSMTLEFRTAYETLSEQMVELERAAPAMGNGGMPDASAMQAMQERMRNREKLDFERTDLSDKMIARLRATLSEEQVQRLGLNEGNRGSF